MSEIDWALLARYAAGECSAEERALAERRLSEEPRYRAVLGVIGRVTAQARMTVPTEEQEERAARLHAQIAAPLPRAAASRRKWSPLLKIAAAILLALGSSIAGYAALHRSGARSVASSTVHTIATPRGQHMSLSLADGTKVILAPASTLRFSATYGLRDRIVELDGEAAFTVTHDERRPFIVHGGMLTVEDLGTRFVMRAYHQDRNADVAVAEGEVAATRSRSRAERVVLVPGDRARVTADSGLTVTRDVSLDSYFGWTEGRLVFQRTPLREAIVQLGRWYDIEIHLASVDLAERQFSAAFRQRQTATEILGAVATALRLDLEQAGPRQYTLRAASPSTAR